MTEPAASSLQRNDVSATITCDLIGVIFRGKINAMIGQDALQVGCASFEIVDITTRLASDNQHHTDTYLRGISCFVIGS